MQIHTIDTKKKLSIDKIIFDADYNEGLVHQVVCRYFSNGRDGNSAQKNRSEVRGGGKKPWRQKGTGRARAGTIRSPIWRSGGVTFASKKRDYSQKLPKKMYRYAMKGLIAELYRNGVIKVVSEFKLKSPKTKEFVLKAKELQLDNALIIADDISENEYLSSRNVSEYLVIDINSVDFYVLLSFKNIVLTEKSLRQLEEKLQ